MEERSDMRRTFVLLVSIIFLAASTRRASAFEDGSFEAVAADAIVVRPFTFVATVLGSALFVVTLPVAAISKSTSKTAEALVLRPARMTFTRPLGELSTMTD
jgi:hypothetical protein